MTSSKREHSTRGLVFNIQRYSLHDGPGIRTTVFLKGCPLRCAWCANPESQEGFPEVAHRDSLCTRCGDCVAACPRNALCVTGGGVAIDRRVCNNCGECIVACRPQALKLFGDEVSAAAVFEQVLRDELFYRNSGGGVTASGGEPLTQPSFVAELFARCHAAGIHTVLDTCGLGSKAALEIVLEHTDLVLYDLKLIDPDPHRRWTGQSNNRIMSNLETIVATGKPFVVRIPLIPGVTDTLPNIEAIGRHVAQLGTMTKVDLMPYHRLGTSKYAMLDRPYEVGDLAPGEDAQARSRAILESMGLSAQIVV